MSDQEGAVISDLLSRTCGAFSIARSLAGSGGHTKAGLAERRQGIVKLGALKLWHQGQPSAALDFIGLFCVLNLVVDRDPSSAFNNPIHFLD